MAEIKYELELSDNELIIVTESELRKLEADAEEFDGFYGWIVKRKITE